MFLIGLTGPSGAGKGEVAHIFSSFGIPVLDADQIYHDLLVPPSECLAEIADAFGSGILRSDGTVDRKKLGTIVFSDPGSLAALNAISHRYVLNEVRRRLRLLQASGVPVAVFDAPQLFEAGADRDCSVVVSVLAEENLRRERIMRRDGLSREDADRRIASQHTDTFFRTHSDFIIENNTNPESLIPAVRAVLQEMGVIPK